jgi:hypothetical protein
VKVEQLELTDEQLEMISGGVVQPLGINLNIAIAPQINLILFSKVLNSSIGGDKITQWSGLTQATNRQPSQLLGY